MSNMLPVMTAEQIAAALDLREEVIEVPEWKSSLKIRAFAIETRDRVISESMQADGKTMDAPKLIRNLVLYGVSEPMLTLEIISKKNYAVIERIAEAIMVLNGMKKQDGASANTIADVTFRSES